jgi:CMP-N,N'-diacetyllegionaminic acid synthase
MIKGKKVVAVITAREGSKGLPNKNIKMLLGKPLIYYTIKAALGSKFIDRVIVSTDGKEIAKIAKKYGAEVPFLRPAHLATDTAHTPPVVEHAISYLEKEEGYKVDIVVTLQPTNPLRTTEHIDLGIKKFLNAKTDSLAGVKEAFPPWWLFRPKGDKIVSFIKFKKGINPYNLERQQLPKVYQPNGAVYITKRNYLKRSNSVINPKSCAYLLMDEESSLDIDTPRDFKVTEQVLKMRKCKKRPMICTS